MKAPPRGWREKGREIFLTPHWGHTVAAGIVLAFNAVVLTALANRPADNKHTPWYLGVFIGLCGALVVAWFLYPFWGKTRVSFRDGIFRAGKKVSLTLGELQGFATEPTEYGVAVFAVKRDGVRIPLELPMGNPLTIEQGKSAASEAKRREHGRAEAEFAAERLTELLNDARSETARYRD